MGSSGPGPLGRALMGRALMDLPGSLGARLLWDFLGLMGQALMGFPEHLWAGPLWAAWALMGRALMGSLGPCEALWAPLGVCGPGP